MTLPQRNRRKMNCDGAVFHWLQCNRGATVQHENGTGSRLRIDPYGPIRFDIIPHAIRFAIANGWTPEVSGAQFWIGYTGILDWRYRFVLRKETERPFWSDPERKIAVTDMIRSGADVNRG